MKRGILRAARSQRRLAKEVNGTPERRKRRKVVARLHERIRWRRENFVQQESRRLVNHYGLFAIESLVVRNLMQRPKTKQEMPKTERTCLTERRPKLD
jgi:putative transposase